MADVVQYRLERMTNELDDLERRGLFSRREIAEIVKQRRKFEYRLKRPSPLKQDFLAYIEYETQFDTLRRLRKKAVARELTKKGNEKVKMKTSVSDFASTSRIVDIYRLAVMRYKGDIELWFKYLEFCRQKKNGRMKKVMAQVIRFHPKVPGVWIYAAAWEFDHNLNVAAARALMQEGLRMCPNSEELWLEYLRMELTYLNKLKARKVALGEATGTLVRTQKDVEEKKWREENEDLFMSLDELKSSKDEPTEEPENTTDCLSEHASSILRTIYEGAIEAVPCNFNLRKRFLDILEAVDLSHSEDIQNEILRDMNRDFCAEPEYWDWLARHEMSSARNSSKKGGEAMVSALKKVVQVYEEAVKNVPSAVMFDLYARFLIDIINSEREDGKASAILDHALDSILGVYEKAQSMSFLTDELACQCISFHLEIGRFDEARKLAEKFCSGNLEDSVKLKLLRVSIEVKHVTRNSLCPSEDDMKSVFQLLECVLTEASISDAKDLWVVALKLFGNQKRYFQKLIEISVVSITKDRGGDEGFSLPSAVVHLVLQNGGLERAREMYKRYLALPHPGLVLYRNCIELESNLASTGDKDSLVNARKLYEGALTTYGQDASLWRDYHAFEMKLGTSETSAAVNWRARKTLNDTTLILASPDML